MTVVLTLWTPRRSRLGLGLGLANGGGGGGEGPGWEERSFVCAPLTLVCSIDILGFYYPCDLKSCSTVPIVLLESHWLLPFGSINTPFSLILSTASQLWLQECSIEGMGPHYEDGDNDYVIEISLDEDEETTTTTTTTTTATTTILSSSGPALKKPRPCSSNRRNHTIRLDNDDMVSSFLTDVVVDYRKTEGDDEI